MGIDRNLTISLVRATEAAALTAGRWVGLGDMVKADIAAANAMYEMLAKIKMKGKIIIGEERRYEETKFLHSGASIGTGEGPETDVVVDVVDGTRLLVEGQPGAISVVAVAPRDTIVTIPQSSYMNKLIVGAEAAAVLDTNAINAPPAWILGVISKAIGKPVRDMTVYILDRIRHQSLIADVRASGARVILRRDADLLGALLASLPNTGVDVMMGIGGSAEGIAAAIAVKSVGGAFMAQLTPQSDEEKGQLENHGYDLKKIWTAQDFVPNDDTFFATTGVTNSILMKGVRYHGKTATTHSLVLRGSSNTRRHIVAEYVTAQ